MKKVILVLVLTSLLLVVGCGSTVMPSSEPTPVPEAQDSIEVPVSLPESEPVTTPTPKPIQVILPGEPPMDVTWISPGKVNIGNFYPGARVEYSISVHNGSVTVATFAITYRYPDHVGEEYSKPTSEVQEWVIIADSTPVLMPKETKDILVILEMPEDSAIFASKWEFWISVKDTTQSGMVQTELASRWLVSMR